MPADEISTTTSVILDGLADAKIGQALSIAWAKHGIVNRVDVTGQEAQFIGEVDVEQAASIARWFGLEIRTAPREKVIYEYKSRFATAMVFGLPALALHYAAPILAAGASMLYPRAIELVIVGWMCIAVGWPILYQAGLAARGIRMTPDLFTSVIVLVSLLTGNFHVAAMALTLAVLQRWMAHKFADRIAGRADMLVPHFGWIVALVVVACALLGNLGIALAAPPLIGLAGVNRMSPGASSGLPVIAFMVLLIVGPSALELPLHGMEAEVCAAFQLMMIIVMAGGWRGMHAAADKV